MSRDAETMISVLAELQQAVAEQPDDAAVFRAAADAADQCIGYKLCTFMLFDSEAMEVQRLYSTNPAAYPPRGRKKKKDTAWGRQVLENGQPFIGRGEDDIRQHFDDHELIISLGLRSMLNMPVRVGGRTLGTMNLSNVAGFYSEEHVPIAGLITGLIAVRFH
ncbi:MAG: GAF domain-containing protein [Alphaproteobacteria bacterium]|nr:GAF domain-containing protein [Alphaproteobacteria bacterium]